MRNFKDFTRAIAGIASALKGINTVVDDIPVPGSGGGGIDITSELAQIGTYNGQPLYAISYEDDTTFSSSGSSNQTATVSATITNEDHILLFYTMSADLPANWGGSSMVNFNTSKNDLFLDDWAAISSTGLKLTVKPKNDSNNIKPTVRAVFYIIKKSESI